MRVLLVVNPSATGVTPRTTRQVQGTFEAVAKVDVEHTTHRGHAAELAAQAHADGVEAVVALGGDGTVADVAGGLLLAGGPRSDVPVLGTVPCGATNVLARTLGLARRPDRAADQLAAALRDGGTRRIGVGHLRVHGGSDVPADRWFVLNAGLGLDAAAIAVVEGDRGRGRRAHHGRYAAATVRAWAASDRRTAPMSVRTADGEAAALHGVIVTNSDPWSYLGPRRLRPTPDASLDLGLDVAAARRVGATSTLASVGRMLTHRPSPAHSTWTAHDQSWVEVTSDRPVALQTDGDYLGSVHAVRLTAVPSALRVLVP